MECYRSETEGLPSCRVRELEISRKLPKLGWGLPPGNMIISVRVAPDQLLPVETTNRKIYRMF